jgi:hypothetical protein
MPTSLHECVGASDGRVEFSSSERLVYDSRYCPDYFAL